MGGAISSSTQFDDYDDAIKSIPKSKESDWVKVTKFGNYTPNLSWFKTFTIPSEINLDENIVLFYVHNNTAGQGTVYSLYIPKKFFYNGTEDYWFYSTYRAIEGRYEYDANAGDNIIFL